MRRGLDEVVRRAEQEENRWEYHKTREKLGTKLVQGAFARKALQDRLTRLECRSATARRRSHLAQIFLKTKKKAVKKMNVWNNELELTWHLRLPLGCDCVFRKVVVSLECD